MIAFVQPFGLEGHGGGARILRSLLEGAPTPYLSVCTSPRPPSVLRPEVEVHLPRRPAFGRLESTRLHRQLARLDRAYGSQFKQRLRRLFEEQGIEAVHAIPHGIGFWHAFQVAEELGLPYILNVHDDLPYNLPGVSYLPMAMERLGRVWRHAAGRIVISDAMGREYNRRYGERPYRIVTDGLRAVAPSPQSVKGLRFYMMGSIHLSYETNFDVLFQALGRLREANSEAGVSLTVRGGFPFPVRNGDVPVEIRSWGTQADVERDLQEVDFLYLPLPFEPEHESFVRFSLATKLITYLGSGIPILYHGPERAAAAELLAEHGAGLRATTRDPQDLAHIIEASAGRATDVAAEALALAQKQFMLRDQQQNFWDLVCGLGAGPQPAGEGVTEHASAAS